MVRTLFFLFMLFAGTTLSGQVSLKGRVTGSGGEPLAGASVILEETFHGVSTGSDGSYQFTRLKPGEYTLVVSFIGYQPARKIITLSGVTVADILLEAENIFTEEVVIQATRANERTPVAFSEVSAENLRRRNMGQDIPYLLTLTPSFVATSDAGTGIGYTSFRIRGTDLNRINVTINGIPFNDSESHKTYFVDQPDLASSAQNIQVQRGAGTTSGGGASFGAAINLQTHTLRKEPYATLNTSAGSFGTLRKSISVGTGLIGPPSGIFFPDRNSGTGASATRGTSTSPGSGTAGNADADLTTPELSELTSGGTAGGKFSFDARLSSIHSDGFIDRAFSDLSSWFISGGYYSPSTVVKAILFSGTEETYQSWNGVPSVRLRNDVEGMLRYGEHGLYQEEETRQMLAAGSRTYNLYTYRNQVDHYRQDHFQLHFSHRFSRDLNFNAALHNTFGEGYYEQYKASQKFTSYGVPKPVVNGTEISRTNLVRRKWLDNDFYGAVFSFNLRKGISQLTWGGGWNHYFGRHFGRIIWAELFPYPEPDYEFYRNNGRKNDLNGYFKAALEVVPRIILFADLQIRSVQYRINGIDDDLRTLDVGKDYLFFNPKAGILYQLSPSQQLFVSVARTNREPNRDNFKDTPPGGELPRHETLNDLEAGWSFRSTGFTASVNLFHMSYHNQLALTGEINDVGAPVMANVEKSHRSGIELSGAVQMTPVFSWRGNLTLSRNKIRDFIEYVDDWDNGGQQAFPLGTTDLAFSPRLNGNSLLSWAPRRFAFDIHSMLVGKQFADNSSSGDRIIEPWFVNNLSIGYSPRIRGVKQLNIRLMVNNLLNEEYESNAWVYSYILGGKRYTMDGYFPQAGRHFMVGLDIGF